MLQRQNVAQTKCCKDKMLQRQNATKTKCCKDKMLQSDEENQVQSAKNSSHQTYEQQHFQHFLTLRLFVIIFLLSDLSKTISKHFSGLCLFNCSRASSSACFFFQLGRPSS